MSALTPKFFFAYPQAADAISTLPATVQAAMQKIDLYLGEAGTASFTGAANTTLSVAVTFGRDYTGAMSQPQVLTMHQQAATGGTTVNVWVTGIGPTGCTINMTSSAAVAGKVVTWRLLPIG